MLATAPYPVIFSRQARRNLHENLPVEVHSVRHRRDAYRT
jgi:hypothetical protein